MATHIHIHSKTTDGDVDATTCNTLIRKLRQEVGLFTIVPTGSMGSLYAKQIANENQMVCNGIKGLVDELMSALKKV